MVDTHNASDIKKSYKQLLIQHDKALDGSKLLSDRALIDSQLKDLITDIFSGMKVKIEELRKLKDITKIQEILPVIQEQNLVVQEMRQLYNTVIQFNKPEKFEVRVCQSREYSHKLQVNYKAIDLLNGMIVPQIGKFFQQKIVKKLEEQFDRLCRQVLDILKQDDIDVEAGIEKIQEIAPNTPDAPIRRILVDVKKTKNKNNHNVMKDLLNWEKQQKNKEDEGNKKVELIKQSSQKNDLAKIVKGIQADIKTLTPLQNGQAKEFYLTFYNPKKDSEISVEHLYQAFSFYFESATSKAIEDTKSNQKMLIQAIDSESLVTASLEEINAFFEKYVDVNESELTVDGITFVKSSDGAKKPSQSHPIKLKPDSKPHQNDLPLDKNHQPIPSSHAPVSHLQAKSHEEEKTEKVEATVKMGISVPQTKNFKVKMSVLEDFDEDDEKSADKRKTIGILKAGQQKTFEVSDGQFVKFGNDLLADFVIPIDELDPKQFTILNKMGQLLLVDEGVSHQTKIKVEQQRGFRLNSGDFIDLGMQQTIFVVEATSEQKPQPTSNKCYNIRYLPKGISKQVDEALISQSHLCGNSEKPKLVLEYKGGQENGTFKTFQSDQLPENGVILVGRHNTCNMLINSKLDGVSRKHCRIIYDHLFGWMIMDGSEDSSSVSGTWVHPKTWSAARVTTKSSQPVSLYNEIQVKADTFTFQFEITEN